MLPHEVPTLTFPPVRLRRFRDSDVALALAVANDPAIPMLTTVPTSGTRTDAMSWIRRQQGRLAEGYGYSFAIADANTDEPVGQIGVRLRHIAHGRVDVAYWIAPGHRGRGYVTAALEAIVDWVETIDEIGRLELFVEPSNTSSWRAAEASGFQREGLLRSWDTIGGIRRDMLVYSHIPFRPTKVSGPGSP